MKAGPRSMPGRDLGRRDVIDHRRDDAVGKSHEDYLCGHGIKESLSRGDGLRVTVSIFLLDQTSSEKMARDVSQSRDAVGLSDHEQRHSD